MQLPPPELGTTLVAARKIPHGTMARGDWNEVGREREKVPPPIPADKRRQRRLAIRLGSRISDASAREAGAAREEYHHRERARH
jgi:hypothetical protein